MDNAPLRKKLSTYLTEKGRFKNVSEELLFEVLRTWEEWPGTAKDFYSSIGFSFRQMAGLIGKAKRLKRDGHFGSDPFKEVKVEGVDQSNEDLVTSNNGSTQCRLIELEWQVGKIIRFPQVGQLLEFLKKVG